MSKKDNAQTGEQASQPKQTPEQVKAALENEIAGLEKVRETLIQTHLKPLAGIPGYLPEGVTLDSPNWVDAVLDKLTTKDANGKEYNPFRAQFEEIDRKQKSIRKSIETEILKGVYESSSQYLQQAGEQLHDLLKPYASVRPNFSFTVNVSFDEEGNATTKVSASGSSKRSSASKSSESGNSAPGKGRTVVYNGTTFPSGKEALEQIKSDLGLPEDFGKGASAPATIKRLAKKNDLDVTFGE